MTQDLLALLVAYLTGSTELAAIVGTRIHAVSAPQGIKRPFITFQIIDSIPETGRDDSSRVCNEAGTVQIDCWGHNLADVIRCEKIIRNLINEMESSGDVDTSDVTSVRPLHDDSGKITIYRHSIEADINY